MGARLNMFVFISLVVAAMLHASSAQTTHVVGDVLGWLVPPGGDVAYQTWAANQTFTVGDVLVFNFTNGAHNVLQVTKAEFDSCNISTTTTAPTTTSPARITITSSGEHYYICTFSQHCSLGQKLAINATAASASPTPQPQPATPPPTAAPSPIVPAPEVYTVGDALGWLVPPGGPIAYQTWARDKTFTVGDILVFNFTNAQHNVLQVTKAEFDSCNVSTTTMAPTTTSPARITITSTGEHYYICTFSQHCSLGQKLAINATAASASPTPQPQPATPPPTAAPSPIVPAPEVYTVGDALGWLVPPGGPIAYQTWARDKTFTVGDILVFNFTNTQHNVLQVTKAEFDSCNVSTTTMAPTTTSPARITITSTGEHYYMCTFSQHCSLGQKLAINVTGGDASPAPAPSSPAPTPSSQTTPPPSSATPSPTAGGPSSSTPSTPATPSPLTPPPPPSSASVAAAALPITFLAVALSFFV